MDLNRSGIRVRLLALVALCLLPFICASLYAAYDRLHDELERLRDQSWSYARLLAAEQSKAIGHSRQLLSGMALSTDRTGSSLLGPDCDKHLQRLLKLNAQYYNAGVTDAQGKVFCSGNPAAKNLSLADRPYFRRAVETREFTVSEVLRGRATGERTIVVAQPLVDHQQRVIGTLAASLDLGWMEGASKRVSLPAGASLSLVDAKGTVVRRYPDGAGVGAAVPDLRAFKGLVQRGEDGSSEVLGRDAVERVVSYVRFADLLDGPAYVRVGMPKSLATREAAASLRSYLLALLAVLGLSMFAAWAGGKRLLVAPIERLTRAADRMGKGDLSARTGQPHDGGEIGQLAAKLDELAEHLGRSLRALKALSAGNRTILRERDESTLLQAMCKLAVEKAGYQVAAVHFVVHDEARSTVRMALAGDSDGYMSKIPQPGWGEDERGRGTVGDAIRSGRYSIIKRIPEDRRFQAWREESVKRGYGSVVSLPLRVDGSVIGVFSLVAREEDAFDEDELDLLEEVADDLSFGIAVIRGRERQEQAEHRAQRAETHDLLTGLPNAAFALASLTTRLEEATQRNEPLSVLMVHLPSLNDIYDSLGYVPGNTVVTEIARRIREAVDGVKDPACMSDKDFSLVMPGADIELAQRKAYGVLAQLDSPVDINGARVSVQVSVGVSMFPGHGDDAELLFRRAGIAAREAASKGQPLLVYRGGIERENAAGLELAAELRGALERRELVLHYQPKVELPGGRVAACEALVRWPHPTKGMIPPLQFVAMAERTGQIRDLTYYVLDVAVRQQRSWMDQGRRMPIAVNLSVRNLYDVNLIARLDGLLATWGVPGELIEFEITESALMEEPEAARNVIVALRERGCRIYIDDFGTGHSSLAYLVSLPVDALKIDRAFVVQMATSAKARSIITSIIAMAHGLGLRVVAEGVETEEELAQLRTLGSDEVQGYYFSRPVAAEDLRADLQFPALRLG